MSGILGMNLIEGIGDEVTIFFTCVLALALVILAWMSTHVSDDTPVNIIIIDRRTLQRIYQVFIGFTRNQSERLASIGFSTRNDAQAPSANNPSVSNPSEATTVDNEVPETDSNVNVSSDTTNDVDNEIPDSACNSKQIENLLESNAIDNDKPENQSSSSFGCVKRTGITTDGSNSGVSSSATQEFEHVDSNSETSNLNRIQNREIRDEDLVDGHIRIKLKYLDERQRWVQSPPSETIRNFKRVHFDGELAEDMVVRFICNGHELHQESQTLAFYNIGDKCVIHCLFSKKSSSSETSVQTSAEIHQFDIGVFMFPIFGIILLLLWYFRFIYRNYFNAMSTFSLIGITLLFIVSLLATWRTHELHTH